MKAIILAAGLGNRLRPFTDKTAKPLLPVANRPVMEHIVRNLQASGFSEIFANVHYYSQEIMEFFGDGSSWNVSLQWRFQPTLTGPAGGAALFADMFMPEDVVVVVSGDALHDIDLLELVDFHLTHNALLSVVMKRVHHPDRYGVGRLDDNQRIVAFAEKPNSPAVIEGLVSCGIYCLQASLLRDIPVDRVYDFGADLIPSLAARGEAVFGFETQSYWRDIGDLSEFRQANLDAISSHVRIALPGEALHEGIYIEPGASIASDVELVPPILIGASAAILKGAKIVGPAILGASTVVGEYSSLVRTVLLDHVRIPDFGIVVDGVIGSNQPTRDEQKYDEKSKER